MSGESDERLSALLDGALAEHEEHALRAELARSPALRERLAALAAVDAELRELPVRPLPPGLHARLRARIDAADAAARRAGPRDLRAPAGGPTRRRARWIAGFAAAAAAALAWYALPRGTAAPATSPLTSRETVAGAAPAEVASSSAPDPTAQQMTQDLEALAYGTADEDQPVIDVLDELVALDELGGGGRG